MWPFLFSRERSGEEEMGMAMAMAMAMASASGINSSSSSSCFDRSSPLLLPSHYPALHRAIAFPRAYRRLVSCSAIRFPPPATGCRDCSVGAQVNGSFVGGVFATQTPAMAQKSAEADVMGLLLKERIVFLGYNMDDFVADAIISQLLLLDAQDHTKDIRLFINSPGGSISAAMGIFDTIQLCRAHVSTIAFGLAASTASIVLAGGSKGKRFAMPNARIMMHQPLGGASGQAIDVEIQAKEIMHHKNNLTRIISEITGKPFQQVEKDIDRDRYMSPVEAMEYGIVDGVIDRDYIIPLVPLPEKVKSRADYKDAALDPRKFLTPVIPDDEIY